VRHAHGQGQMAQLIRRKEEYYRSLIEHISDVILVADRRGVVTYHNPATSRVLGYTFDELEHVRPKNLLHPEDLARIKSGGGEPFSTDTGTTPALIRLRHRDGHWVPLETIVTNWVSTPAIEGVVINMRDVTERQRVELELRQSQKLQAVGRLAAGIAHEINTPIQFIGDNLHFLRDAATTLFDTLHAQRGLLSSGPQSAAASEDISMLEEEVPLAIEQSLDGVQRVAIIVGALKEFAHPDSSEQVGADLNHALKGTLTMARSELRSVADIQADFADLPPICCHLGELNQVFLNLLVNAAHAVSDADRGAAGVVRVSSRREGDWVVVRVQDNGCGVPESIRTQIFDPFFTTKDIGRGSGQGLALARSIVVDQHGGSIDFTSSVGEGSTFIVRLPIGGVAAAKVQKAA
jgi:PAS domain S-box-containing protein